MPLTVFKYPLKIEEGQKIKMPTGAKLLSVGSQHTEMVMWALVDPDAPKVDRLVSVTGTGWPSDDLAGMTYVGTHQTPGLFVWHLFDGGEVTA